MGNRTSSDYAIGINDAGTVVGIHQQDYPLYPVYRGFVYQNSNYQVFDFNPNADSYVYGFNNSGVIVGDESGNQTVQAVTYKNGVAMALNTPANTSPYALGINNAGTVVGVGVGANGFIYQSGVYTLLPSAASGPFQDPEPRAINDQGQIVGNAFQDGYEFTNGAFSLIHVPGSLRTMAQGINGSGEIIGTYICNNNQGTGFYEKNGVFSDLIVGATPSGINNAGQIVGIYDSDAQFVVPEPSSAGLLAIGLAGLIFAGVRLRRIGASKRAQLSTPLVS